MVFMLEERIEGKWIAVFFR